MKNKIVLMMSTVMAMGLLASCGHKHSYVEVKEVAATCTVDGSKAHFTCEGCDKIFDADKNETTLDALKINALGHDYKFDSFVWSDKWDSAQAKYVCSHDNNHIELHDATVTKEDTTDPGCETKGLKTYTATYDGHSDTKEEEVAATGHSWGTPTYTWADDYSTCEAKRVCSRDASHVDTETVDSSYSEKTPATYDAEGEGTYTATFTKEGLEEQTATVTLKKLVYHGEVPLLSDDGKTLTYGLYPQTNVNDEDLLGALNELTSAESNGWYLYNEEYYAKVSATPNNSSNKFDNGTTIVSGTTYWFKCEPITWNVLSNDEGECYLLSDVLLDARRFDAASNNYEYSDLRLWLNDDFYFSAFNLGNSNIQTTTIDNSAATTNSSYNPNACNNTQDRVFLPSYQDYLSSTYGFSTSTGPTNTRSCKTTDWARARGSYYNTSSSYLYNGNYWIRSPYSEDSSLAWFANIGGGLSYNDVSYASHSVRPSITIKIEQA